MKLFGSSSVQAGTNLLGAVACMVHTSTIATASEKPPVPDPFHICSETDQSTRKANALEGFELEIGLSDFDLTTKQGIDAAKMQLRQISHSTCRIRILKPSTEDRRVYAACKENITTAVTRYFGFND